MGTVSHQQFTTSAALSPCNRYLALGAPSVISLWSLPDGRCLHRDEWADFGARLVWRNTPAGCLRWRPDGKRLAYVHDGCFIKAIDPFAPGWPADIQIADYGGHIKPFDWGWVGCLGIAVSASTDPARLPLRVATPGPEVVLDDLPEVLGGFTQEGPFGHIRSIDTEPTGRWLGLVVEGPLWTTHRTRLLCLDRMTRTITCAQPVGTMVAWNLAADRVAFSPNAAGSDQSSWVHHHGLRILKPSTDTLLAEHDITNILELHWAPTGRRLAVVRRPDHDDPRAVIFVEDSQVRGSVRTQVRARVSELADRRLLDWAPDGHAVVLLADPHPELWSTTAYPERVGRLEHDDPAEAVFWGQGAVVRLSLDGVSFWAFSSTRST